MEITVPVPNLAELTWMHALYAYMSIVVVRHFVDAWRIKRYNARMSAEGSLCVSAGKMVGLTLVGLTVRLPAYIVFKVLCLVGSLFTLRRLRSPVKFWSDAEFWKLLEP